MDFGSIWPGFGEGLGGLGEGFGRIWLLISETPALPRQLAWRHNARGSPTHQRVRGFVSSGPCPLGDGALLL